MLDVGELNVPDWVPPPVRETASILFVEKGRDDSEIASVVRRFLTDPRMERVWATLLRRKRHNNRPSHEYVHFAGPPLSLEWAAFADTQQHRAMQSLSIAAVGFYFSALPVISKSQLDGLRQPYLDIAACLRDLGLENQAVECELRANFFLTSAKLTVVNRPGDDTDVRRQKGYLMALGREVRELFGSPLYGTVATIASVVIGRKITVQMVREVCS